MHSDPDPVGAAPQTPALSYFRFRRLPYGEYLLTNDAGDHITLAEPDFAGLRDRPGSLPAGVLDRLRAHGFIDTPERAGVDGLRARYGFLNQGPSLHIVVLTLRCDHRCVYCQTSRKADSDPGYDMDRGTAGKVVDFILQTTAPGVCIEFQGGEPLLNFDVLRHTVETLRARNTTKRAVFSVVSNLRLLDDERLRFLLNDDISICTSLDGPADVHNRQRVLHDGNSFETVTRWIRRIVDENRKRDEGRQRFNRLNALMTVSREILTRPREVVDLYVDLGLPSIHLRTLNPFGYGGRLPEGQAYSAAEFLEFYTQTLDYIVALNRAGTAFFEKTARVFLEKIIGRREPNYLDLRSPCGAGIGQLAYNYDGSIFPCDEGRMLSAVGDNLFLLGNVREHTYREIVTHGTVGHLCVASTLEGLPGCHDCAYNPYCGVCPLYNYAVQGSLFGHMPTNERCKVLMGIQDYLFSKLRDNRDVFAQWVGAAEAESEGLRQQAAAACGGSKTPAAPPHASP